jgi:hypothetical protein
MEKIIYRFKGNGLVWDSRRNKMLLDFNKCVGYYETDNKDTIDYLIKNNYKYDKIVKDIDEKVDIAKKIDVAVVKEEEVKEIIEESVKEEENKEEIDLPIPEGLSRESITKLLDDKGVKYKKNMKIETLQKLLDDAE